MGFFTRSEEVEFPSKVTVNEAIYDIRVDLIRKKNSSVVLRDMSLVFRLSSFLSNTQKKKHFEELLEKMLFKISKMPPKKNSMFGKYLDEGYFEFANERFEFLRKNRKSVGLKENVFLMPMEGEIIELEKAVSKLLSKRLQERMDAYVRAINAQSYNFSINGIKLSYVGSKWGHCTHDNVIMINIKLLRAPKEVMDYVIYHELSHIKVKDHSQRFWNEVSKFCPNYKKLRKYLKNNPPELF